MKKKFIFPQSKLDNTRNNPINNDNRIKISSPLNSPYCAIGLLKLYFNYDTISYRTGFLIKENVVLTAGHNIFDSRINPNKKDEILGKPIKIEFYPGLNENESEFKKYESKKFFYDKENFPKKEEDYGIIIFDEKIVKNGEFIEIKEFDKNLDGRVFFVAGYPINKSLIDKDKNNIIFEMWEGKGGIINYNINNGIIATNIKSSYGQSGSGLMYFDNNDKKFYCVGIHVASNIMENEFYSTMITKKRFEKIQKWINEN